MSRRIQNKNNVEPVYKPKNHLKNDIKAKQTEIATSSHTRAFAIIIILSVTMGLVAMGFFSQKAPSVHQIDYNNEDVSFDPSALSVTMFSSPGCGCCHLWAEYLEDYQIAVIISETSAYVAEKEIRHIPVESYSCHTAIFGNYFVEGHVPITAINKLLTEKPDIDGIALPSMPSGSPGMDGDKTQTFHIQAINDGQVQYTFISL